MIRDFKTTFIGDRGDAPMTIPAPKLIHSINKKQFDPFRKDEYENSLLYLAKQMHGKTKHHRFTTIVKVTF